MKTEEKHMETVNGARYDAAAWGDARGQGVSVEGGEDFPSSGMTVRDINRRHCG
jgi:hypothetical protein